MKKSNLLLILFIIIFYSGLSGQPTWTQKSGHLGNARYDFAGFSLNGKGYIGGGRYGGPFNAISEWQEFNPVTNSWLVVTPMPYPFTALSAFSANGFGYVANGVNDAFYNYETYKYNQAGNNWSTGATNPYPRLYAACASDGSNGYIIGGYGYSAEPMNDTWEYNTTLDAWNEMSALPVGAERYYASAFSVGGNIYVFGGTNAFGFLNDLWKFSPTHNQWTQVSSMPSQGRQQSLSFVLNDEAYIIGGTAISGPGLKEVWNYNAANDTWTQLADFPGTNAPFGGIGFTIDGKGYIVTGNGSKECWEFDPGFTYIADSKKALEFSLYPNPVYGKSTLFLPDDITLPVSLMVYDCYGRMIKSKKSFNSEIPVNKSDFTPGIYFLRITDGNSNSRTSKFIIE